MERYVLSKKDLQRAERRKTRAEIRSLRNLRNKVWLGWKLRFDSKFKNSELASYYAERGRKILESKRFWSVSDVNNAVECYRRAANLLRNTDSGRAQAIEQMIHDTFMELAIQVSWKDAVNHSGGGPFGAVIVNGKGRVVAVAHNEVVAKYDNSSHAEAVALRKAGKKIGGTVLPEEYIIYSSCEPCMGCMVTLMQARVREVYVAAIEDDAARFSFIEKALRRSVKATPKEDTEERTVFLGEDIGGQMYNMTVHKMPHMRDKAVSVMQAWKDVGGQPY